MVCFVMHRDGYLLRSIIAYLCCSGGAVCVAGLGKKLSFGVSEYFFLSWSREKYFYFFLSLRNIQIRNSNISFFLGNKEIFPEISFYFSERKK